jgi:hypothetical protein
VVGRWCMDALERIDAASWLNGLPGRQAAMLVQLREVTDASLNGLCFAALLVGIALHVRVVERGV